MISVIVCGRNDGHGGNIAKRASLSLNNLAMLLRPGEDEIVFVDWNTPDIVPSFPEILIDSLTARALRLIRVLRVRPSVHAHFADRTHLPFLDSVARNVGMRRARAGPQDWILSTTTDVLVAPRHDSAGTLADVLADAQLAFYHCPRFGVPEIVWETLPADDPEQALVLLRRQADALWLKEVVRSSDLLLFDGPGDFQLFPMSVAHRLDGFDERMLWTYHTDTDMAVRASRLLGGISSLSDRLEIYHCDHYRVATVHHAGDTLENDLETALSGASDECTLGPDALWGLPDVVVEEFDLGAGLPASRLLAGLYDAIPRQQGDTPLEVSFTSGSFNRLGYRLEHVLPYVANFLAPLPPEARIYVSSTGRALHDALRAVLSAAGRADPLPLDSGAVPDRGSILIFDFGFSTADAPSTEPRAIDRLEPVVRRYRELVMEPTARNCWVIAVNAVHTIFERLLRDTLAPIRTPLTQRVRFGRLVDPSAGNSRPFPDIDAAARQVSSRLAAPRRLGKAETAAAVQALRQIRDHHVPDFERAPPSVVAAAAEWLGLTDGATGARFLKHRQDTWPSLAGGVHGGDGPCPPNPTGYAEAGDWDNPDWLSSLRQAWEASAVVDARLRHRATWEIGQQLFALTRFGRPLLDDEVLLVLARPSAVVAPLSWTAASVRLSVPAGNPATDILNGIELPLRRPVVHWDEGLAPATIAILGSGCVPSDSIGSITRALAATAARLAPGALLSATFDVDVGASPGGGLIAHADLASIDLPEILAGIGLELLVEGAPRFAVSTLTAERYLHARAGEPMPPHLGIVGQDGMVVTTAHLTMRKCG